MRHAWHSPPRMDRCASVQPYGKRGVIGPCYGTCARSCTSHPGCADHSKQHLPCNPVHMQQSSSASNSGEHGSLRAYSAAAVAAAACRAYWRACAMRQWSSADKRSRSASITSWLTERSLKKAVCDASLLMPLISFAARPALLSCWHNVWMAATIPSHRTCTAQCKTAGQAVLSPHSGAGCVERVATDAAMPIRLQRQPPAEQPSGAQPPGVPAIVNDVRSRGHTAVTGTRVFKLVAVCPARRTYRRRKLLVGGRHVASCRCMVRPTMHQPHGSTATSGGRLYRRCKPVFLDARDNCAPTQRRNCAAIQKVHYCGGHPVHPVLVSRLRSLEIERGMRTGPHGKLIHIPLLPLMQQFQSPCAKVCYPSTHAHQLFN